METVHLALELVYSLWPSIYSKRTNPIYSTSPAMFFSRSSYLCLFFCLMMITGYSNAQSDSTKTKKKLSFKDPEDGALDLSQFLLEANGVLPVIIPITEPAVGYGGGAAILYFHKRKKQYSTYVPPNVSGLMGLYTQKVNQR